MVSPGYTPSNVDKNVRIAHGVSLWFKRSGQTNFADLGVVADVSFSPTVEFFDFFSNRKGTSSRAKRILTTKGLTLDVVLQEVSIEGLRLAFFGAALATISETISVQESAVKARGSGSTISIGETADDIIAVTSIDGDTTYAETTDWTHSGGASTLGVVTSGAIDVLSSTAEIYIHYVKNRAPSNDVQDIELLSTTTVEGEMQFQIRNQEGGLEQTYILDSVNIAPNGAVSFAADSNQTIPLQITANELNSAFGRIVMTNIADS